MAARASRRRLISASALSSASRNERPAAMRFPYSLTKCGGISSQAHSMNTAFFSGLSPMNDSISMASLAILSNQSSRAVSRAAASGVLLPFNVLSSARKCSSRFVAMSRAVSAMRARSHGASSAHSHGASGCGFVSNAARNILSHSSLHFSPLLMTDAKNPSALVMLQHRSHGATGAAVCT